MLVKAIRNLLVMALCVGGLLAPGAAMAVMVNQLAPDFTLPSTTGKDVTLSQFRGEKMVLLEFYGLDFGVT
jgi:peroxiredoxin Q/BCP